MGKIVPKSVSFSAAVGGVSGFRYLDFTVEVKITPSQAKSNQLRLVG